MRFILIENQKQRGTNVKVIKSYIQCTLLNTLKPGFEQIEQMSFSFFFYVYLDIESVRKRFFFRLMDNSIIRCRFR